MDPVPSALTAHALLSSAGADAGFAALVGLAILVLLFFAQARETATLRANLERAGEQIEALEARLQAVARAQAAAVQAGVQQPARPPFPARPIGAAAAAAALRPPSRVAAPATPALGGQPLPGLPPAAPAGVGAPALSAATRLIPVPSAPDFAAGVASAGDLTAIVGPAGAAAAGNGDGPARSSRLPGPAPVAALATGAALAGASGSRTDSQALPPRVSIRKGEPASASPKPAPRRSEPHPAPWQRSLGARLAPWLIGLAALGVGVAAILVATNGPAGATTAAQAAHTSTVVKGGKGHAKAATLRPSDVTVAVLNGTDVAKLAESTGQRLATIGYKEGTIHNAPNQTHATTIVAYLAGHQRQALQVASALRLGASSVQAVDPGTLAVACPAPGPCTADVVVTIGQDLANTAGGTPPTTTT
ncbi:MAG: LytR C-terminal domain-containing protein [Solirubrobacteraceae bacterium]